MKSLKESFADHFSNIEFDQFIDDELPARSITNLEDHLACCVECRREFRARQTLILQLDTALSGSMPLPSGFAGAIAKAAADGPTIFGRKVISWTELIVIWFLATTIFNPVILLFSSMSVQERAGGIFPRFLTEGGPLVRIVPSIADSAAQLFLRLLLGT
jgi:hypothetical protein